MAKPEFKKAVEVSKKNRWTNSTKKFFTRKFKKQKMGRVRKRN
ncbi:hypothetical protein [Enterococcus faecalis]|nr:hypothetical protein [Enterococcus faecalis]